MTAAALRQSYRPTSEDDWRDCWDVTCRLCARSPGCEIVEAMIEARESGDPWPADGWVTDPGAGVTCLSYQPRSGQPISRQYLRRLSRMNPATLPPVCGGCAARKGTEASVSLHTRRDFAAAVQNRTVFTCHERPGYCGGWIRALLAKREGRKA